MPTFYPGQADYIETLNDMAADFEAAVPGISLKQTIAITDAEGYFNTDTVEAALAQLGSRKGRKIYTSEISGFDGTGATNMATLLNSTIASISGTDYELVINSPVVKLGAQLVLKDDVFISMEKGCYFLRAFTTTGTNGLIAPTSGTTADRVFLEGIKVVNTNYTSYTGNIFAIKGNDCTLIRCEVEKYGAGRFISVQGDRCTIISAKATDPNLTTGVGGIRLLSGTDFFCAFAQVDSGDDTYQMVPASNLDGTIRRAMYYCCRGSTSSGKFMVAGLSLHNDGDTAGSSMTGSITDSAFVGMRGHDCNKALRIKNEDSEGEISNILVMDCDVDMTGSDEVDAAEVISGGVDYAVSGVRIRNLIIRNPYNGVLQVNSDDGAVNGLNIDGLTWDKPSITTNAAVQIKGVTDGSMRNVSGYCNGGEGVQIGPSDANSRTYNFHIDSSIRILDVPASKAAVKFFRATNCSVDGLIAVEASGASGSIGVSLTSNAANCVIGWRNDLSGVDTSVSDSGTATARVARTFSAARKPTTTDDVTTGATALSTWLDTAKNVTYICRDATASAAVWIRQAGHPGYRTGRYYSTIHGSGTALQTIGAVDTIYAYPFLVREKVTISGLALRVGTIGTASSWKGAIYAADPATTLPIGAATAADNTGTATTSLGASLSAMAVTLQPGWYWVMQKHTGTLPQCTVVAQANFSIDELIGKDALSGNNATVALSLTHSYATAWPTMTGGESWADYSGTGTALLRIAT